MNVESNLIDWPNAPEGATHRYGLYGLWYKFDFVADTAMFCTDSSRKWSDSDKASVYVADGSVDDMIARPVEPKEVWSRDGLDGNWNFDSLAELIKSDYGHGSDSAGPMSDDGSLQIGDIVHRGIKCYDDPADFIPDGSEITDWMWERAQHSPAAKWNAGLYPEIDDEARDALNKVLEPLKAWARKHCQPTFFIVESVTTYELTEEDVRAAMAQESAQ